MRPSNKKWSLTVHRGWLYLDAPHGNFEVRGIAAEMQPIVAALPDGTDVECEGSFDGGGTISNLVVTRIRRILKDMSGRVMQLPDAIVSADGRLAATRARVHFAAGRIDDATRDVGFLLALDDDQAIGEYERLPLEHQLRLREPLIAWQAKRRAAWRAMRHLPVERWTDAHVKQAVEQALTNGGVFGAAPGIRVEALLEELERREMPIATLAKQTQRLRRAQATEGDTFHRISTDVESARVIGADAAGVYVAGKLRFGEVVTLSGAQRQGRIDFQPVVLHLALDGRELKRWVGLHADRIVEGVALQIEIDAPAGVRLSDGKLLFELANRIEHHDGELVWGVHARDPDERTMRSEIRHIATGLAIATFDGWVDDVAWNTQHIFVYGAEPQTLTRDGRFVSASVPPIPAEIEIETATGRHAIPASHAPWLFGEWQTSDAGGWIVHHRGRQLYLAASEPGATWVHLELATVANRVDVAPPWLAIDHVGQPILLFALAEAMSAQELRVDGKRVAKRAKATPGLDLPPAFAAWYGTLASVGLVPARPDVERDALLYRLFGGQRELPSGALARILVEADSPCCIEHADYYVEVEDDVFEQLNAALASDGVHVRETARRENDGDEEPEHDVDDDDDDEAGEVTLTLQVSRHGRTLERPCSWVIDSVMVTVDKLLDELGAERRLFALTRSDVYRRTYVAITREQRRALVAAGIEGIRSGPRSG